MVIEAASLGFGLCASLLCFMPTELWPFYGFCWSRFENKQVPIMAINRLGNLTGK